MLALFDCETETETGRGFGAGNRGGDCFWRGEAGKSYDGAGWGGVVVKSPKFPRRNFRIKKIY
jgi:hypothetical protein